MLGILLQYMVYVQYMLPSAPLPGFLVLMVLLLRHGTKGVGATTATTTTHCCYHYKWYYCYCNSFHLP